jgi:hypothetical protein
LFETEYSGDLETRKSHSSGRLVVSEWEMAHERHSWRRGEPDMNLVRSSGSGKLELWSE